MSQAASSHRYSARHETARCAVLTVSDSRTPETDVGGRRIVESLERDGHLVAAYEIVPDEPRQIEARLESWIEAGGYHLICTTGGTGMAPRDTTIEVVERLLDKKLDGFGEIFRMLSYAEIEAAAMLSRATAGLAGDTYVFAMPGSPAAVSLAMEKLILPELRHLLGLRRR